MGIKVLVDHQGFFFLGSLAVCNKILFVFVSMLVSILGTWLLLLSIWFDVFQVVLLFL